MSKARLGTGFRSTTMASRAAASTSEPKSRKKISETGRAYWPGRDKRTIYMNTDLFNRVRDACVFVKGLTMTTFFERAAEGELSRLAAEENRGRAFPTQKWGGSGKRLPTGARVTPQR